ncbi:F-box/kelch-repeat protein [Canna indica]|uniref:F-box/kelch-repeat protein n=1 Tax=Canna indica TaxID=4628 RepID=A0AAQ3K1D8_9LILI|nr:F-box/kelch-repeat protein [Canna indica]
MFLSHHPFKISTFLDKTAQPPIHHPHKSPKLWQAPETCSSCPLPPSFPGSQITNQPLHLQGLHHLVIPFSAMNPTAGAEHLPTFSTSTKALKKAHLMASSPLLSPPSSSSSTSNYTSSITHAGSDQIISILYLLPVESIISFSMTCRRFRFLSSSDSLWESICRREWGSGSGGVDSLVASFPPQERPRLSWKRLYEKVVQLSSLSCRRLSCESGDFPDPRAAHSLIFFSGWLVLFGGGCDGGRHLDDTWVAYTGNGHNKVLCWKQVNSGIPSGRFGQTCTLISNYIVLFGGINDNGDRLNDTWIGEIIYDGHDDLRVTWRLLDVDVAPPPRGAHAASGVGDKRVVIHGGIGTFGLRLNDTWILYLLDDFRSGRWHQIMNVQSSPPSRSGHSLTWIAETYMVLFGGRGSRYEVLNDVWFLSIGDKNLEWKELKYELTDLPSEMPLPQVGHSATILPGSKILIYGGEDSSRRRKDDFWVLDIGAPQRSQTAGLTKTSSKLWKEVKIDGRHPQYRSFHGACTDQSRRYMYVFGGMIDGVLHPAEAYGLSFSGELYQLELVLQL